MSCGYYRAKLMHLVREAQTKGEIEPGHAAFMKKFIREAKVEACECIDCCSPDCLE